MRENKLSFLQACLRRVFGSEASPYRYGLNASAALILFTISFIITFNLVRGAGTNEHLFALLGGFIYSLIVSALLFIIIKSHYLFTAKKNTELLASEHKYRALSENLALFISRFGLDKKYVYLNKEAKNLFQKYSFAEKDVLGKKPTELYKNSDDSIYLENKIDEVIKSKEIFTDEFSLGEVYYKWQLIPEFDGGGKVESVLSILLDISDIKNAEEKLLRESNYLNTVIESAPLAVLDLNRDGTVASIWNEAAEKMFGWKAEEVIGKYLPYIQEEGKAEFEANVKNGLENKHLVLKNILRRKKSGEDIYINVDTCPIPDEKGNITRILAFIEDVTQKKLYREEIHKLSEALKQSPYSVIITNLMGTIEYVNPHFTSISGYEFDEAVGKNPMLLLHGSEDTEIDNEIRNTLFAGNVWKGEFFNKKKNGENYWASVQISPVIDENGMPICMVAIEEDITEKKRRDKQLEDSLHEKETMLKEIRKLSEAIKQNPNGLMITRLDATIEYVNPAFCEQSGYSLEECIGKHPMLLLRGEVDPEIGRDIGMTLGSGNVWKGEFRNKKKNGEVYWSSVQIGPIKDEAGNTVNCVGIEQDITEKKQKDKQLEETLLEKEVMLKEIHHRVKNNLQIVLSLLKMQAETYRSTETINALKTSRNRINSMALVHENLYQSKEITKVDLNSYVNTLVRNIFYTYGVAEDKIRFRSEIEDKIEFGLDTSIPLGLLINEAVSNSLKHGFPDGRKGEILLECRKKGDGYSLRIKDTGVGLPKNLEPEKLNSLGMQLIQILCSQLDGELNMNGTTGAEIRVNFKEIKYKSRV
ncbi:MAG: PAS domain S-box protein [Chlorobi bacterium]|nr:PAS domain S-box protein [Chlorobiota bacterium]MCI0716647.1 PAS domain S-box protein [Chlorobiota bacterium]